MQLDVSCADLDATVGSLGVLGFRLEMTMPADDPAVAVLGGHGIGVRVERPVAPSGAGAPERIGRAGMHYRDLLPGRDGGFIASHITIPDGGPVADYVHHHDVRFQLIFCRRGWVRVVYEDQGPPFTMRPGDCVVQPPHIRHRVLESSPGLEVVELTTPDVHATYVDHDLALPTVAMRPERDFGGQRFLHDRAAGASWRPLPWPGFEARAIGVDVATDGLAGARIVRSVVDGATSPLGRHGGELRFWFVLEGAAVLRIDGRPDRSLVADDAAAVPDGVDHALVGCSGDFQLFEVSLPAASDVSRG